MTKPKFEDVVADYVLNPELAKGLNRKILDELKGGEEFSAAALGERLFHPPIKQRDARARNAIGELQKTLRRINANRQDKILRIDHEPYRLQLVSLPRVQADEFYRFVEAICSVRGLDETALTERFSKWVSDGIFSEARVNAEYYLGSGAMKLSFKGFCEHLTIQRKRIHINDARILADAFDIRSLLLHPLFSVPVKEDCIALDPKREFLELGEFGSQADSALGSHAHYLTPPIRLHDANANFVWLKLEPGGVSDVHEHPGDELILVRRGNVRAQFARSGMITPLKADDWIHFYAEETHQLVNESKEAGAELFIVRFYQLQGRRTRQAIMQELLLAMENKLPVNPQGVAWVRQMIPAYHVGPGPASRTPAPLESPANIDANVSNQVADYLGLARFLREYRETNMLSRLPSQEQIEQFEAGDQRSLITRTNEIAQAYGIGPFLLAGFKYPPVADAIVIRDRETDYEQVAHPYLSPSSVKKVRYFLPKRNLSCSDISIALVELETNGEVPENNHPGFEAILVTEGTITLRLRDPDQSIELSRTGHCLCHFRSSRLHSLANYGDSKASMFVIRFYRDGL